MAASRSLFKRVGYRFTQYVARLFGLGYFRLRILGKASLPPGPVLVCSNHQSYIDPILVGCALPQRINYLARQTLFRFGPLRWLIRFLDAIPINRDGMGLEGIKETLRRLKRQEAVLIFPEGTRTRDGRILPLKAGFIAIARRGKATLLPVGLDGAFDAWPRTAVFPSPEPICVCFGEPLTPEAISKLDDEALLAELERRMQTCFEEAKANRLR